MTPHEREQLLELAEQIVANLRSRLAGIGHLNFQASDFDEAVPGERRHLEKPAPVFNKEEEPHDQV